MQPAAAGHGLSLSKCELVCRRRAPHAGDGDAEQAAVVRRRALPCSRTSGNGRLSVQAAPWQPSVRPLKLRLPLRVLLLDNPRALEA